MGSKKWIAILLVVMMMLSFSACGNGGKEDVLATLGEIEITQIQLDQYTYLYSFLQGYDVNSMTEENLDYVKSILLEDLIALNLIKEYYKGDDSVLPEDYEKDAQDFLDAIAKQETADAYMKEHGIDEAALKEFYVSQYYSNTFFEEMSAEMPAVSDQQIRDYYDQNPDQFKIDEVTAKHILVEDEKLAQEILDKLKGGADFGEMAKEYGTDATAETGGDLGTFGRGAMVKEFEDAVFALEPGQLSDVVKTQYGYHLIYVSDKKQGMETFEESKADIRTMLENNALTELYTKKIEELKKEFNVEYLNEK